VCLCLLVAALCAIAPLARATVFGSVKGVVHDPQHRPIAGAQVTLKSRTSEWSRTAQSEQNGEFLIEAVPIGDYTVTVSAKGFDALRQAITVESGSSPVLHFPLNVAALNQKTTVSAYVEGGGTESVTPRTLVNRKDVAQTAGADRTNSLRMITDYVPGAYVTHDQLHIRGGHQVSWLIDGVEIPNTNIASNAGPQIDPKDIDYLEVQRGSYDASYGDRSYGVFDVVPRTGFEKNNEAELTTSFGAFHQTNDQLNFGSHTSRFAYFGSLTGNRSDLGLETPIGQIHHDAENGYGGFGSFIFNANARNQFRLVTSLRSDYYQIPYDPNPADAENLELPTSGLRDADAERDGYAIFSWVRTIRPNLLLTVSPFYHYNRANYRGAPNDFPVSTNDGRTSHYAGMQATLAGTAKRNDFQAGVYGFVQQNDEAFAAAFNDLSNPNFSERETATGGLAEAFVEDKFHATPWLTLSAGVRQSHFTGGVAENATSPRFGAALRLPVVHWVFRAFYGHYYQAPPLAAVSGPLLSLASSLNTAFVALHGERDEEHQFGLAIPLHGWTLDADTFQTRARNFFDHNNLGESNIFIPVTIDGALIQAWEVTLRSPRIWNRGQVHLAYSNQVARARGAITGGLICYPPSSAACQPDPEYSPLDHDQRNTLNFGFEASMPWKMFGSLNLYYGSGFTNGDAPPDYLPGHTTVDISMGKAFGERYSIGVTALNVANRHLLIDNSLTFGGFHYNDPREIYGEFRWRFHY